ncbi:MULTISPECIES: SDR family NAD(P)-dependent oxidoreductase [unclassified Streptomyces]|uniref:SDR family NAD(P)-dependent oxidoreductase n=1 Tax=unclassified Streptomyces TaxID=2593676 RepID=UPI00370F9A96
MTPTPSGRLAGKVALITGTAGGQGRAAALLFAAEGAVVVGTDVNADGAKETVELVRAAGGRMDSTHPLDLSDEAGAAAWVDAAAAAHGGIDIVYNNAGATRFSPIAETSYADWSFTVRNELDIVFLVTRQAWPHLIARGGGSVLLVGSTAGLTGSLTNTRIAHTATKGGVVAMTRQLAAEGAAHGIRANCVSPGMIRTPATEGDLLAPDHPMRSIARAIPLGRIGTPEDVARCALFLASDEAAYVTGANLVVDGGWSAVLPGAC